MSATDPAETVDFNQVMRDKIVALGGIPVTLDLQGATATNLLWRQLVSLLGSGGGEANLFFLFRPGAVGPLPSGIYSDWATLYADAVLAPGPITILIDDSIISPAVIPAGNWNFPRRDVTLASFIYKLWTFVSLADGVTLNNVGAFSGFLDITANNTGFPVITLPFGSFPGPFPGTKLELGTNLHNTGTEPFFEIPPDSLAAFGLLDGSQIDTNIINLQDGILGQTFALIACFANSTVLADTVRSDGVNTLAVFNFAAASRDVDIANQPNFLGTIFSDFLTTAEFMRYVAASAADWSGSPPATIAEALDRIAAVLSPIP